MLQRKESKQRQSLPPWRFCFYAATLLMLVGVTFVAIELEGFTQRRRRRRKRVGHPLRANSKLGAWSTEHSRLRS